MPMGIVSDKDFNSENSKLNPQKNITPPKSTPTKERGPNVPDSLRKIIGDTAETDGRQEAIALAAQFGISPSSASAYGVGATSTKTYNDRPNAGIIRGAKERISKKARAKLMLALNHLTEDKLEGAKAHELSGIAKDMSAIVKNMDDDSSDKDKPVDNRPAFLVYAPTVNQENHYQTVIAKE